MFKDGLLTGARILVTGGGTGIGRSISERLVELGANVVICGRREEVLEATAAEINARRAGAVTPFPCDIRDPAKVDAFLSKVFEAGPLTALVNNAAGNFLARSETLSSKAIDAVLASVLHGSAYMTIGCGQRWLAAGLPGNVLSIITTYASTGSAFVVPSAMGKAGVLAMTRSLAVEWGGRGVRLNAIAPGPFPTAGAWERLVPNEDLNQAWKNKIPLQRFGRHEELADLAVFLLSERSGYINGEVVTIDGGEWLKGAGQFNLMERLSDDDWAAMRGKAR